MFSHILPPSIHYCKLPQYSARLPISPAPFCMMLRTYCASHIGILLSRFFHTLPVDSIAMYLVYKPLYADHKSSDLVSLCRTRTINPYSDSLECGTQRVTQST